MNNNEKFKPVRMFHPGITLREKLEELGMSVKEFALRSSKPEKTIIAVLNGDSSVTPEMSVAFEQITMIPARVWLNIQRGYDEYMARKKREEIFKDEKTIAWTKSFPYAEISKLGWVPSTRIMSERITNLFAFFKVTSVKAWENYFLNQELKSAFRISLAGSKNPYAISVWLRKGEILASEMTTKNAYSEALLKDKLPQMLSLVKEQPADFAIRLRDLCSEAGVKLIYVNYITHAPINGCARWIEDTPCIQMTDKQKRNDIFWFSFFHEIGHILLHGKKDVFLEDSAYLDQQREKENEADTFASNLLLSKQTENEIIQEIQEKQISKRLIEMMAEKYQTHPAIIIGRLQHKGLLRHDMLNECMVHISLFDKRQLK